MATGDRALAGEEEHDIQSHFFPPDPSKDKTIHFKGVYIRIVNKETGDVTTSIDNKPPSTVYASYKIPAGYTCYIRGASAYFDAS